MQRWIVAQNTDLECDATADWQPVYFSKVDGMVLTGRGEATLLTTRASLFCARCSVEPSTFGIPMKQEVATVEFRIYEYNFWFHHLWANDEYNDEPKGEITLTSDSFNVSSKVNILPKVIQSVFSISYTSTQPPVVEVCDVFRGSTLPTYPSLEASHCAKNTVADRRYILQDGWDSHTMAK